MSNAPAAEALKELMDAYNKARSEWLSRLGPAFDEGAFHAWFTKQVIGRA